MKSNEIIKAMMEETNTSQMKLQEMLGKKSLSSITGYLKSDVRCDTLREIAEKMGCTVFVKNNSTGTVWVVGEDTKGV